MSTKLWNALIKTHRVTSRKKVAKLKKAARQHAQYVLIRSGGSPGIMYVESEEQGVKAWVNAVAELRYKDYSLVKRPAPLELSDTKQETETCTGFEEATSVQSFAARMSQRGLLGWWRKAMGYEE